jgi:large subunit ribosomal protein L6
MSKIGKQPITVPAGVTVTADQYEVTVKSAKGALTVLVPRGVKADFADGVLSFSPTASGKQARSNWGTVRALVQNAIVGLTQGFQKTLVLEGVGFRVTKEGEGLTMNLGFSHPVKYAARPGITFEVEKNSILTVKGFDRALVGQVAAEIRAIKKPEPYKGKGFHYSTEVVRRKAGKKAAATAGAAK